MSFNIADLFEHAVDAVPDRIALAVGDQSLTFTELDEKANRFAHTLANDGITVGDHIGIYGMNSEAWIVAMLAAFKIRAIPININYRYVADELTYLFSNADLVALVHDRTYAPLIANVRDSVPNLQRLYSVEDGSNEPLDAIGSVDFAAAVAAGSPARDFGERSPDDLYMLYTGGTTGMPKGVMWRQEDVFFALGGGVDAYTGIPVESEHTLADKARASAAPLVSMCTPPLMHGAAQWSSMRFLFEGNTVVLVPKFDPEEVWAAVERNKVQNITITGDAMGRPLIETLEANPNRWDVSSVFVIASSAAVFSRSVKARFHDQFPGLILVDAIGSTETGHNGMAIVASDDKPTGEGVGVTVKGYEGSVVLDEDLQVIEPGSGVVGMLARGGHIPIGYYKDEVKTAATFVTGKDGTRYAIPGDYATVEADGTITLLGRGSVSINTGGEKVYPEEVEGAIKAHPAIFDAVVIGMPDERWGQRVTAVVQLRDGQSAPELSALAEHCRESIARYKVPRALVVVDEVVRSPSGKPDYPWAKRAAEAALS